MGYFGTSGYHGVTGVAGAAHLFGPIGVKVSSATASVNKNAGTKAVTIQLTNKVPDQAVTVNYATADGTAQSVAKGLGQDFTAASDVATIAAGDVSVNKSVTISNNPVINLDRTFAFTLSSPNIGSVIAATQTVTIVDNARTEIMDVTNPGHSLAAMVGDWTTDDTAAFIAILAYVENPANGKFVVYFPTPSVAYKLGSAYIEIPAACRNPITLMGQSSTGTIIKRQDSYVGGYLMNLSANASATDLGPIAVTNLMFDGNRNNNVVGEQHHLLRFSGNGGNAGRVIVRIQDINFQEHENSDCISTVINVDSHLYRISGVNTGRDMVTILGGNSRGWWYNLSASGTGGNSGGFEVEVSSGVAGYGGPGVTTCRVDLVVEDSDADNFEFTTANYGDNDPAGDTLTMKFCTIRRHFTVKGLDTKAVGAYLFEDCDISCGVAAESYHYLTNAIFNRCNWTITSMQGGNPAVDTYAIGFLWLETGPTGGRLTLNDCNFYVDEGVTQTTGKIYALRQSSFMKSGQDPLITLNNCNVVSGKFDVAIGTSAAAGSGNIWTINGGTYNAKTFMWCASYIPNDRLMILNISTTSPVTLGADCTKYLHVWNNNFGATNIINDGGTILNQSSNYIYAAGILTNNTLDSRRAITGAPDPGAATHGIKAGAAYTGDQYHATGTNNDFTCTVTGYDKAGVQQNATWTAN